MFQKKKEYFEWDKDFWNPFEEQYRMDLEEKEDRLSFLDQHHNPHLCASMIATANWG